MKHTSYTANTPKYRNVLQIPEALQIAYLNDAIRKLKQLENMLPHFPKPFADIWWIGYMFSCVFCIWSLKWFPLFVLCAAFLHLQQVCVFGCVFCLLHVLPYWCSFLHLHLCFVYLQVFSYVAVRWTFRAT